MSKRHAVWFLVASTAVVGQAHGVRLSVGADALCTHRTLAAAIADLPTDSDHHVVRMMSNAGGDAMQVDARDRNVEILGGFATCPSPEDPDAQPDGSSTVLSGTGGDARSVLSFGGSAVEVKLRRLRVVGGDATGSGGGVRFNGSGSLDLQEVEFSDNRAGSLGGGLYVESQGLVVVDARDGVVFRGNTADLGGGVFLRGRIEFRMYGRESLFDQNTASGGGAIRMNGPVRAAIGATAIDGGALFRGNAANVGSAISVYSGTGGQQGALTLYSIDSRYPLGFVGHRALMPGARSSVIDVSSQSVGSELRVCAWDLAFEQNLGTAMPLVAAEGAGASFMLNSPNCLDAFPPSAARCSDPRACSRMVDNALDDTTPPNLRFTHLLLVSNAAAMDVRSMSFHGNRVGGIAWAAGGSLSLGDSVVGANDASMALFDSAGSLVLDGMTIADNRMLPSAPVIRTGGSLLDFRDSIVHQPGIVVLTGAPAQRSLSYLGVHDASGLPGDGGPYILEPPLFSDPQERDWRLRSDSPLVDVAPARGGTDRDGRPRDIDTIDLPDVAGPRDLGAFESPHAMSGVEYLFEDAFE